MAGSSDKRLPEEDVLPPSSSDAVAGPDPNPDPETETETETAREQQLKQYKKFTAKFLNRLFTLVVEEQGSIPIEKFPADENVRAIFTAVFEALSTADLAYLKNGVWHFPEIERRKKMEQLHSLSEHDDMKNIVSRVARIFETTSDIATHLVALPALKVCSGEMIQGISDLCERVVVADTVLFEANNELKRAVQKQTFHTRFTTLFEQIEAIEHVGASLDNAMNLLEHAQQLADDELLEPAMNEIENAVMVLQPVFDHFEQRRLVIGDADAAQEAAALLMPEELEQLRPLTPEEVLSLQPVNMEAAAGSDEAGTGSGSGAGASASASAPGEATPLSVCTMLEAEVPEGSISTYRKALKNFWSDGILTTEEQRTLGLLRRSLKVPESLHKTLELDVRQELGIEAVFGEPGDDVMSARVVAASTMTGADRGLEQVTTELLPPPPPPEDMPKIADKEHGVEPVGVESAVAVPLPPGQEQKQGQEPGVGPEAGAESESVAPSQYHHLSSEGQQAFQLLEQDQVDEALGIFTELLRHEPTIADLWIGKGRALEKKGEYQQALNCLNLAMTYGADGTELWFNMGVALEGLEEYNEALNCYSRVIKEDSEHARAWYNRARLLAQRKGDFNGSLKALDMVLKLLPESEKVIMYKGIVLRKMGETQRALECFGHVLELNPDNSYAQRCKTATEKELEQLQDRLVVAEKVVRCGICLGYIKSGWKIIPCECNKHYHEACSRRVKVCPYCNAKLVIS